MSTSTFDTLDAMRRLEQAGMDRAQAEATVETMREAQAELATKADLRTDLAALESRLLLALAELRARTSTGHCGYRAPGIVAIIGAFIAIAAALEDPLIDPPARETRIARGGSPGAPCERHRVRGRIQAARAPSGTEGPLA